jgi:hypothetical protein
MDELKARGRSSAESDDLVTVVVVPEAEVLLSQ